MAHEIMKKSEKDIHDAREAEKKAKKTRRTRETDRYRLMAFSFVICFRGFELIDFFYHS
jgi:hypothetical protein